MSKEIVVRLSSSAGRSRVTIVPTATLGDLQAKVQTATGVDVAAQRLAFDDKGARAVGGSPSSSLASVNIVNGTQIYLVGAEATMAGQVLKKVAVSVDTEKPVPAAAPGGASSTAAVAAPAPATDSKGRLLAVAAPAPATAPATAGGASSSKPPAGDGGGGGVDPTKWSDKADRKAKFEVFDTFLRTRRYETSNLQGHHVHKTMTIKAGGMMKLPPSVSVKQQPYRHVDQVSVYNDAEIQNFMSHWVHELLPEAQQRMGWLFGYYLEDSNYGDKDYVEGTRVVVEGIYEPPQQMIGGECVLQDDPDMPTVLRIAEALGLEMVGHIWTSWPLDGDQLLTGGEVLRISRLQNEHSTDAHFTKYRLSKFVSVAIRPDPEQNGDPGMSAFMVSDQCSALVRDGMLAEEAGKTDVVVREGAKGECMPTFLVEGKGNRNIPTDFFIVRVQDANPKKRISLFTHADFPRENRPRHLQQRDDLKKYFQKRSAGEPSWSRFADFHLLLFIAKALDVDTAVQLCDCVRERQEVQDGTKMLFEALMG